MLFDKTIGFPVVNAGFYPVSRDFLTRADRLVHERAIMLKSP
jgi:hypothetical protein